MAQIQKGTTYSTGDQVTATNLNALADAAILLPGAITDQTAKTVPLAADTVLIHSAADTALRKSTLTQLFSNATGIPLTTGVTGILPAANGGTGVNNGANTITIAGNVTHAGAFTQSFTATANTSLTLPVTGTLATLAGSEALSNKTITASPISGSTGAFTTLSASGLVTVQTAAGTAAAINLYAGSNATTSKLSIGQIGSIDWDLGVTTTNGWFQIGGLGGTMAQAYTIARSGTSVLAHTFYTGGASRAEISSTGLAVTGALSATGQFTGQTYFSIGGSSTDYPSSGYNFTRTASAGVYNYTTTDFSSRIEHTSGGFKFFTAPSGTAGNAITFTERANITSTGLAVTGDVTASGVFYANSETVGNSNSKFGASFPNANCGLSLRSSDNGSGVTFAAFRKADATVIGSISRVTTTDAVVYNTTSDGRLKENLRDFTDSGRLIDSLKPRVFDWKNSDENGKNVIGFIAQEEHAADPIFAHIGAVSVGDEDPETITKQWQRSDSALIPILVAELKALRQRVAALENSN